MRTGSGSEAMPEFDAGRILAKSDGKSLWAHVQDCLRVFHELWRALPAIPNLLRQENFFDLLFCSVYFHDWGKAHAEFQKVLKRKKNEWAHGRHEIYSVPFVEMLPFPPNQRELICQSILGHHKDFETLWDYLHSDEEIEDYRRNTHLEVNPLDFKENLQRKMDVGYLVELKKRFQASYDRYAPGECRFDFVPVDFSSQENPIKRYAKPVLQESTEPGDKLYWRRMLLLGATRLCDHMGSAEIGEIPRLAACDFHFLDQCERQWYSHQTMCGEVDGNLFLMAPTGSGKTEAALKWIRRQLETGHQGRIFYILPYTASINAMHRRLIDYFESKDSRPGNTRYIGILHGKLSQYLAQYFENLTDDPLESQRQLSKLRELHKQMVHPLKVVTPFQLLKYCYGVKGFEMGFTELAGGMLIFDEIHAYDMQTFAQIVSSLKWLIEHLSIRVLIMTATLPSFMLKELQQVIGSYEIVRADDTLLEKFTRHRVHVLSGTIFDQLSLIEGCLSKGQKVIVACNTVANAQEIFRKLYSKVEENESVLLHSRFISKDRLDKEQFLARNDVRLLVGTQAIEVSLDIDFDVMFTEPAPLDALIQRFGRINRRRKKGISPVYVCSEGGEHDGYIYSQDIVEKTLQVLSCVEEIKESELQNMLDEVYPDWLDRSKFEETTEGFLLSLNRLKPFMASKEGEEAFYDRFTGVTVLPVSFRTVYDECIRQSDFIEAERLLISIHLGMFHKLLKQGLVEKSSAVIERMKKLKQFRYWVVKCKYDPQLGLLEEEASEEADIIQF